MTTTVPLQFGLPGGPEVLIILLIAVLLFGANKIPKLARSTGEAMGEFQKGRQEVEEELKEMQNPGTDTEQTPVEKVNSADSEETGEPEIQTEPEEADADADADVDADDADVDIADAETDEEKETN